MMNTTLSLNDFASLSPLWILLFGSLLLILVETFAEAKSRMVSFYIALTAIILSLFADIYAPLSDNSLLTPWLRFDGLYRFFTAFFLLVGLSAALLSASFFQRFEASQGEYYFLLLSALFGLILIGASADFLTLFLGLETLSISLYIWCGYMKRWTISHEASLKYFLLSSMSAAFLLFGIALIYGALGTTRFSELLGAYQALASGPHRALFFGGIALVTLGFAFKATIVPFHIWAPDVYEGAPTPITAFMAVGTKAGAIAAFALLFLKVLPQFDLRWNEAIAYLAYPTLIYSNIVALRQVQLRRFFAYSGISHAGFLLIPLAAGTQDAFSALAFYLVVYALATLGSFAVLAFLDHKEEGVMLADLKGLFYRSPYAALLLALCLLTLGGIPPTVGFFAKFFVFKIAFQTGYYGLVIVGLLTTILSAFYYLRIVSVMFAEESSEKVQLVKTWPAYILGCISLCAIVALSCYPGPLLSLLGAIK